MTDDDGHALTGLMEARTVQLWLRASGVSEADAEARIGQLAVFLAETGQSADDLVESLFRQSDVGPKIKLKRRQEVIAQIAAWEEGHGRAAGNVIRTFLIQNGVALTVPPVRW